MTKILHLVSTFQVKTDTKWLLRLLPKIDRQRFDLAAGAFYGDGPAREALESANVCCRCLNVSRAIDPRSLSGTIKLVRDVKPDIIHTHLLRADLFGGLAGRITRTPVVSTVYAYGQYRRMHKRPGLDHLLDKSVYRLPTRIIAVCDAIRDDLINHMHVPSHKIAVIHTGMDPLDIPQKEIDSIIAELNLPTDKKIVVVPARISYEKGIDCFIHAAQRIIDQGLNPCFVIAGSGPMEHEMQNLSAELALGDNVRFTGFLDNIEPLLAAADIIVLPSYSEGLPNAALEAFAVSKPLVASAVGGLIDLSRYDPNALVLAKPNDPADLADKIIQVLKKNDAGHDIALAGLGIIKGPLSTQKVAERYEQLYLSLG